MVPFTSVTTSYQHFAKHDPPVCAPDINS